MRQGNMVLSLTTDLLANGSFNHLKDDEISALHHIILKLQGSLSAMQQNLLLTFWNNADVYSIPPALLYRCNMTLLQFGRPPIENFRMETEMF
jgi:hypothetical protein